MIIPITVEEAEQNLDFCLALCDRGVTFKITREDGKSVIMTGVGNIPDVPPVPDMPDMSGLPLGMAGGLQPEADVRNFVNESLAEMHQEL